MKLTLWIAKDISHVHSPEKKKPNYYYLFELVHFLSVGISMPRNYQFMAAITKIGSLGLHVAYCCFYLE